MSWSVRVTIVLAALAILGCSSSEPKGDNTPAASVTPSITASPGSTSSGQNTSTATNGRSGQTANTSGQAGSTSQGGIEVTETVSTSNAQPLTTMYITPGVDRGWQNAATPEQRARGTWDPKPEKPVDTSVVQGLGDNGAPVIDDGIVSVKEG